ncbi:MAG: RNA 2',3'-cyclic phosphodiesterase [Candidatus Micrarchaeota archaeon]|nr:RNA 2',3'-cyclic phosphodiesterase [Candidatus Micrarchaeota archaeon]
MRAFIGLGIPESVKDRIIDAERLLEGPGIVLVKREALHITLHFLGDVEEGKLEMLESIMESVKHSSFSISIEGAGAFGGKDPHVVYLKIGIGSAEIISIYDDLSRKLREAGMRTEGRLFTPHVTIARVKHGADTKKIEGAIERIGSMDFGSFGNPELFIKKSVLTPDGPLYTTLFSRSL